MCGNFLKVFFTIEKGPTNILNQLHYYHFLDNKCHLYLRWNLVAKNVKRSKLWLNEVWNSHNSNGSFFIESRNRSEWRACIKMKTKTIHSYMKHWVQYTLNHHAYWMHFRFGIKKNFRKFFNATVGGTISILSWYLVKICTPND